MIQIIPSILTNDPDELMELIKKCEGLVERVSIDIIDGKFANNKTIDPSILSDIDTALKIDYQLMVIVHFVVIHGEILIMKIEEIFIIIIALILQDLNQQEVILDFLMDFLLENNQMV